MDVGSELRRAREQRGLSLQDLSGRTKISLSILRAMENNKAERLPGGIFTRGFLKAYAREVGLDPTDISQRYVAQFEPPSDDPDRDTPDRSADAEDEAREPGPSAWLGQRFGTVSTMTALALVAAGYFALTRWHGSRSPEQIEGPRAADVAPAADAAADRKAVTPAMETATTGSTDSAAVPVATADTGLRVELESSGPCWVQVTADGERVIYRLMQPGERETIDVGDDLVLRAGNPSALALSVNGSPGRLPGRPGAPTTVRITRENYREFLR